VTFQSGRELVGSVSSTRPRLYTDLAGWFHLLTHPGEYAEEAAAHRDGLVGASDTRPRTLLELGSGGGNDAFHLKRDFECTLSDLSPAMLEVSRGIDPECAHVAGDLRTLRPGREFDALFVHDRSPGCSGRGAGASDGAPPPTASVGPLGVLSTELRLDHSRIVRYRAPAARSARGNRTVLGADHD
jgi:hypothetical protein